MPMEYNSPIEAAVKNITDLFEKREFICVVDTDDGMPEQLVTKLSQEQKPVLLIKTGIAGEKAVKTWLQSLAAAIHEYKAGVVTGLEDLTKNLLSYDGDKTIDTTPIIEALDPHQIISAKIKNHFMHNLRGWVNLPREMAKSYLTQPTLEALKLFSKEYNDPGNWLKARKELHALKELITFCKRDVADYPILQSVSKNILHLEELKPFFTSIRELSSKTEENVNKAKTTLDILYDAKETNQASTIMNVPGVNSEVPTSGNSRKKSIKPGDSVHVLVVDDEAENRKKTFNDFFNKCNITATYLMDFECVKVIEICNADVNITVLLLDVMSAGEKAGIKLLDQLGKEPCPWVQYNGKVQIVFYSNEEPEDLISIKIAKRCHIDVSGVITYKDMADATERAYEVIWNAHKRAERFKKYPMLANLMWESEFIFHPNNLEMRDDLMFKIDRAGRCWEPVLIQGDTGTGKELVAKAIRSVMKKAAHLLPEMHGQGGFIAYNIGSTPNEGNIQYIELFGAMRGSYSGAVDDRIGLFERASKCHNHGATIFLDEIGDAEPNVQVSLLRVLQESKIIPMGGFHEKNKNENCPDIDKTDSKIEKNVTFRLITASHKDLPERVARGEFREDLYYRLSVITISIPPLRNRPDDIPVLAMFFVEKLNKKYKMEKTLNLDSSLREELKAYSWPGNVRELESVVASAYVMSPGTDIELLDEVRKKTNKISPEVEAKAKVLYEQLKYSPKEITAIRKKHGIDVTKALAELFVKEYGDYPKTDNDGYRMFCIKQETNDPKKWNEKLRKYFNGMDIFTRREQQAEAKSEQKPKKKKPGNS
jgi:DNA-binding NtrC family response regulator